MCLLLLLEVIHRLVVADMSTFPVTWLDPVTCKAVSVPVCECVYCCYLKSFIDSLWLICLHSLSPDLTQLHVKQCMYRYVNVFIAATWSHSSTRCGWYVYIPCHRRQTSSFPSRTTALSILLSLGPTNTTDSTLRFHTAFTYLLYLLVMFTPLHRRASSLLLHGIHSLLLSDILVLKLISVLVFIFFSCQNCYFILF